LTMPEADSKDVTEEDGSAEDFLSDEDDEGAQVLATLQAKRKKQQRMYALVALVVVIMLAGGWFFLQESSNQTATMANQQVSTKVQLSAKEIDMKNVECRQAAAMQWLLDSKVMHTSYSAEAFVRMLKLSEQQTAQVRKVCKNTQVIQEIIQAATNKEKPAWFKAEIEAMQNNRQR